MSQISKCPKVTVVLTYWEASGDVSELRYKSLLYFSSKRSYCITRCCQFLGIMSVWYLLLLSMKAWFQPQFCDCSNLQLNQMSARTA